MKIRRRADPHAAEADLQAADQIQPFHEDGALVEFAVAVGVLEDRMRSLALRLPARALRIACNASATQSRPRSSMAKAIGCRTSGSPANSVRLETRRQRHRLRPLPPAASPANLKTSAGGHFGRPCCGGSSALANTRLRRVKAEIVEIDVAPAAAFLVDEADENLLAHAALADRRPPGAWSSLS